MTSRLPMRESAYIKHVACRLRSRKADELRGSRDHLEQLDRCSDMEIVARFTWTMAIIGAIVSFLASPLILIVLQPCLPTSVLSLLWWTVKATMAASGLTFAFAAWMTFKLHGEN